MKILAVGDIFGRPGRKIFALVLPRLIAEHKIDFVIANGENASGGRGLGKKAADEIFMSPVDVVTSGNHIWEHKDVQEYFDSRPILRPHNVNPMLRGRGADVFVSRGGPRVAVVSLQGCIFMDDKGERATNPLLSMDELLPRLKRETDIVIVDFHAEATSEKRALAWYLDGRVTALLGTHTHVQTSDEEILPGGLAYISDLGMTGPHASVIGLDKDVAVHRFLTGLKKKYKVAEDGVRFEGVLIDVDERTGKSRSILRIKQKMEGGGI